MGLFDLLDDVINLAEDVVAEVVVSPITLPAKIIDVTTETVEKVSDKIDEAMK